MTKTCQCGAELGPRNKSGRCRTCAGRETCARMNADPTRKEKARATMSRWTPEQRAAKVRHLQQREIPPEEMARRRARGAELARMMHQDPEIAARRLSPEVRKRAGAKRTETTIGWCPPEWRDAYRKLVNTDRLPAADAKAMILEEIRVTARREVLRNKEEMDRRHRRDLEQRY